ncbi:MAG: squalene/phytoene synthase family protein [Pseudomonadota bacterium]
MSETGLSREDLVALKQREPLFYFADLLLPEPLRQTAQVLHAFHGELNALAAKSTGSMVGQIRFQWWSEVIDGDRLAEAQSHPMASELSRLVRDGTFDSAMLTRKVEAHIFDLYHDPMPDNEAFEAWSGETRSVLFQQLGATLGQVSGPLADACGHAGVALGYADILLNLPRHRASGRRFLPSDLLASHDFDDDAWFGAPGAEHVNVVKAAAQVGLGHVDKARAALKLCPDEMRQFFSVMSAVRAILIKYGRSDARVFEAPLNIGQLKLQWLLMRGF